MFGGLQGLTFSGLDGGGKSILYATTSAPASTGNALVKLIDVDNTSAFTFVAQAAAGTLFRGVALAPVSTGTHGDYNNNGVVDAADYVLWRNGGPLQNDPIGPPIGSAQYDQWKANFGKPGPGAGSGSALGQVPEPTTIALVGLLVSCLLVCRRKPSM